MILHFFHPLIFKLFFNSTQQSYYLFIYLFIYYCYSSTVFCLFPPALPVIFKLLTWELGYHFQGLGLKKTVSLSDFNITQVLEEDSNQGYLTGDFSKVSVGTSFLYFSEWFWVWISSSLLSENTRYNYASSPSTHNLKVL